MKKLAIVIPVYNEQDSIKKVLLDWRFILNKREFDIIVINDGSTDNTYSILLKVKKIISQLKILNKKNSGHGQAIYTGYEYAVKKKYDYVFQVDSDDQFKSSDFKKIWKLKNKIFDLVLGYRYSRQDPLLRVFLSKIVLRIFIFIYFKKIIYDANIPYRLIKLKFLQDFLYNSSKKYIAPNLIMSLFAKKIIYVRVNHFRRSKGVISWPIKKLISFGIRLFFDIIKWKKIISLSKKA
jgi:glycosyltransferase involved in cell wall biosynthesis